MAKKIKEVMHFKDGSLPIRHFDTQAQADAYAKRRQKSADRASFSRTMRYVGKDPLSAHENHTFSNACPVCMGDK